MCGTSLLMVFTSTYCSEIQKAPSPPVKHFALQGRRVCTGETCSEVFCVAMYLCGKSVQGADIYLASYGHQNKQMCLLDPYITYRKLQTQPLVLAFYTLTVTPL